MASRSYAGVLHTFSVGGSSQLEFLDSAELTFDEITANSAPASRFGGNTQTIGKNGRIRASLKSDRSTAIRVSHLDLSAASLGSVNLLSPNILGSLTFNIGYEHIMTPSTGDLWDIPEVADGNLSATLLLTIDTTATPGPLLAFFSDEAGYADQNLTLDYTLNAVQYQTPMRITGVSIPVAKAGRQEYTLTLSDRSARSGVTLLPSGTTSLWEKALNDPKTALAFDFRNAALAGIRLQGNMVWASAAMTIEKGGGVVLAEYEWLVQGAVTDTSIATS